MQEFDKHDVDKVVQLDTFEAERQRQTAGLRAPETVAPQPLTEDTHESAEADDDDEETQQPEPSLFDILQDDAEDELDEDLPSNQHT